MREGDAGQGLTRRTSPYARMTFAPQGDGTTVYSYPGGIRPVAVITGGRLDRLYRLAQAWGEKLLEAVHLLEGGPGGTRDQGDKVEDPVESARHALLTLRLMVTVGHLLIFTLWVGACVAAYRIKLLLGIR